MTKSQQIGQKLLLAFHGKQMTQEMEDALATYRPAGITLFRSLNIDDPTQLRGLIDELQTCAARLNLPPLLIAADQEGGQLMSVGQATPLPGNMALGAAGSTELARRAGEVLGRELAALGINVDYAPCVDVNVNYRNPVIGTRSFGEDPKLVAEMGKALVEGMQSQGVVAAAKHFPGHGDTTSDSHHGLSVLPHDLERLQSVELPPFEAAIIADVKMIMSAHLSIPALDGPDAPPATLSSNVLEGLLRGKLGFNGLTVSDAMDMRAIRQGDELPGECARAAAAGIDLLLVTSDPEDHKRAWQGLSEYSAANEQHCAKSLHRIAALKSWLSQAAAAPDLAVVGCDEHLAVAREIAERSVTLVRDENHLLPVKVTGEHSITVIIPRPADLTPADTSSYLLPGLAQAIRRHHPRVEEIIVPFAPDAEVIRSMLEQVRSSALVVVGTLNAFDCPAQAELVNALLASGTPTIVAAMRLPYDLLQFPSAPTYLCTYSIQQPSMDALADVLFGRIPARGRLPVAIPGIYPVGHGLE